MARVLAGAAIGRPPRDGRLRRAAFERVVLHLRPGAAWISPVVE